MSSLPVHRRWGGGVLTAFALGALLSTAAHAAGKVELYGIYMTPENAAANEGADPGFGLGIQGVLPVSERYDMFAAVGGIEFVNLLSREWVNWDRATGLRTVTETEQNYGRLFVGGQLGPHGRGFFRPHIGADLSLNLYGISNHLRVPDDTYDGRDITQDLGSEYHLAAGYDLVGGLDLNFSNKFSVDLGAKFVKTFGVPQQLGFAHAVTVHPQYYQAYVALGLSFGTLSKM